MIDDVGTMHWCVFCAFDGIPPPPDPDAEARRASYERRVQTLAAAKVARERRELHRALKEAQRAARLLQRRAGARLAAQRRAEREAAAPGFATPQQLAARWAYYGGKCWMCGEPAEHMDHVKPLAAGGAQWPSNQRPACWQCNLRKGARWPFPSAA